MRCFSTRKDDRPEVRTYLDGDCSADEQIMGVVFLTDSVRRALLLQVVVELLMSLGYARGAGERRGLIKKLVKRTDADLFPLDAELSNSTR